MNLYDESPAVQQALNFVKSKLAQSTWYKGEYLPPLRALAPMAGVSLASMVKAIALLREEGLVTATQRHRIVAGVVSGSTGAERSNPLQWQGKRQRLESDLAAGRIGTNGVLPSIKELQARYGTCFRTMRKILLAMESDEVVTSVGKRYAMPGVARRAHRQRVVFITFKGYFSVTSALNHPNNRIVNILESECMRCGLQFELIEIDFYDATESRRAASKLVGNATVAGFILNTGWNNIEAYQHSVFGVLIRLESFKKPTTILDDAGIFELPPGCASNPLFQVYRIESTRAAERMARYLIGLGHKNALYVSMFHFLSWSAERFAGIQRQFSRAGFPQSVHLVGGAADPALPDVLVATGLSEKAILSLLSVGNTPSQLANLKRQMAHFRSTHKPPYPGTPRLTARVRDYLVRLIALNQERADALFNKNISLGALDAIGENMFDLSVKPLFERALDFKEATVWICENDALAMRALPFLRERGKRVPDDLSIVGFDNVPVKALESGLTTFDFNAMEFIHRMLNFILRPPKPRGHYRHVPIEIEGTVMIRTSTAKAGQ